MTEKQPKFTRRDLLQSSLLAGLNLLVSAIFPKSTEAQDPTKIYLPIASTISSEKYPESIKWIIDQGPEVLQNKHQEIRSLGVNYAQNDSEIILLATNPIYSGTNYEGIFIKYNNEWMKINENVNIGITRHILPIPQDSEEYHNGYRFVGITDRGIYYITQNNESFYISQHEFNGLFFCDNLGAQTGKLVFDQETNKLSLFVGGSGGVIQIKDWNNQLISSNIVPIFQSYDSNNTPIFVRCMDFDNNGNLYIGGWYGRSGTRPDEAQTIGNGAGLFRINLNKRELTTNQSSCLPGTEKLNINSFWIHPNNPNIIIIGTEGAGNKKNRNPEDKYPSVLISYNSGNSWQEFNPNPWEYDIVTPNQGIVESNGWLYLSFWNGPMYRLRISDLNQTNNRNPSWENIMPYNPNTMCGGHIAPTGNTIYTGSYNWGRDCFSGIQSYTP